MEKKNLISIIAGAVILVAVIAVIIVSGNGGFGSDKNDTPETTTLEVRTAKLINPETTTEETEVETTVEETEENTEDVTTEEVTTKAKKKKKKNQQETTTGYVDVGNGNNYAYDIFVDEDQTVDTRPYNPDEDDDVWSDFY